MRTRVNARFDKFLPTTGRPPHALTGSDAIDRLWRELADGHGRISCEHPP